MKSLFVTTLLLWSAGAMAATESEKSLFEMSAVHLNKFTAEVQAENQTAAVKSVLSILESDRPAIKANGVNTESRELKAEAAETAKTL